MIALYKIWQIVIRLAKCCGVLWCMYMTYRYRNRRRDYCIYYNIEMVFSKPHNTYGSSLSGKVEMVICQNCKTIYYRHKRY